LPLFAFGDQAGAGFPIPAPNQEDRPALLRADSPQSGGTIRCRFAALFFLTALVLCIFALIATAQQPAYLDTHLSPRERAHDLVGRMTLEEKANQLEDWGTSIPRLGIPDYQTWNESLHGVARAGYATVFPQAIGMAATWDPTMVQSMGEVISDEARAKYNQAQREGNIASSTASHSGRPTSTSFATRAGAGARRPTAKIRFSPAAWESLL
jgi:hypothetical protein